MSRIGDWLREDISSPSSNGDGQRRPVVESIVQDESVYAEYGCFETNILDSFESSYHRFTLRKITFIVICLVAIVVAAGLIITYGDFDLSFSEVYSILWNHILNGPPTDPVLYLEDYAVWSLRLPRVLVAIIAGFGLSVAGAVMQSTLKNPMADSYTTGVSSGAAFGATISIVLGINFISNDISMVILAFICSLIPTALIVAISTKRSMSSTSMILAGLAVMYIFNALTSALKLTTDSDSLAVIYRWQVGSLNNMTWDDVPVMLCVTVIGSILVMLLSNKINILSTGDDAANSLGIDASKLRIICLVIVSLITASIVSFTGTIGFVGLVAPHVARLFIGSDNRFLIPASALFGALLMMISDILGRVVLAPAVLEVGVVTAFIGGPMFLYLILRQRKEVWT